nr:Microsomal glutathione S-transferase 3 [Polyrhizophydium stewartii]
MTTIALTHDHGYAAAVGLASALFVLSLGIRVGGARRKAEVPYPYLYADRAEAEKDPKKHLFNCAQRAHQNTLETYPIFLVLYTLAALQHPRYAAIAGAVWIAGRHVYASGYSTGDPAKRNRGAFAYLGLIALLVMSVMTSVSLIRSA